MKIAGIISDTHGLLRPAALRALQGVDLIIHAGDIGNMEIIPELRRLAPTLAICGNVDRGPISNEFPQTEIVEIDGLSVYVLHDREQLDLDPQAAGFQVVVFGHSHQQHISLERGVLYLNPASAGPRRFSLPISLALLRVRATVEIAAMPAPWPDGTESFTLGEDRRWAVDVRFVELHK